MKLIVEYVNRAAAKADFNALRLAPTKPGEFKPTLELDGNIVTFTYETSEQLREVAIAALYCTLTKGERMGSVKIVGPNQVSRLLTNLN